MATAYLSTTVTICWETASHHERDCDADVDYTFDGEKLRIDKIKYVGSLPGISEDDADELVWQAVNEQADEAYGEWIADYGDFLFEQARDARLDRSAQA